MSGIINANPFFDLDQFVKDTEKMFGTTPIVNWKDLKVTNVIKYFPNAVKDWSEYNRNMKCIKVPILEIRENCESILIYDNIERKDYVIVNNPNEHIFQVLIDDERYDLPGFKYVDRLVWANIDWTGYE